MEGDSLKRPRVDDPDQVRSISDFWKSSPPVSSQLPLVLENRSRVEEIEFHCTGCGKSLRDKSCRGEVHPSMRGYRLTAFGYCEKCNLLTPFQYEIRPYMNSYELVGQKWMGWKSAEVIPLKK